MIHDSPTHSALYLEELALCGLNVMSEEFREKMQEDHRDITTILCVMNMAMIFADLDIEDRFKVLEHLQHILGVIRKETGKSLSGNWISELEMH
jgi:hypothetical protein